MLRRLLLATLIPVVLSLAPVSVAVAAEPASPAACVTEFESAVPLRKAGKLREARAWLTECAAAACPDEVREECVKQLETVSRAIPTVVFEVRDASGNPVKDATVTVDGRLLANRRDAAPTELDPGTHRVSVAAASGEQVVHSVTLQPGEKGRREVIALGSASPTPAAAGAGAPADSARDVSDARPAHDGGLGTMKVLALVAAGLGTAAVVTGSVFGVVAISKSQAQKNACPSSSSCTQYAEALADHSSATSDATISTVTIASGLVAIGASAVLWLAAPKSEPGPSPKAAVRVVPAVGPGAGGLVIVGAF